MSSWIIILADTFLITSELVTQNWPKLHLCRCVHDQLPFTPYYKTALKSFESQFMTHYTLLHHSLSIYHLSLLYKFLLPAEIKYCLLCSDWLTISNNGTNTGTPMM